MPVGTGTMSRVRCYAGTSYPERPVAFEWEGRWLDVAEVLWSVRTLEGMTYDIVTGDGQKYRLEWRETEDFWLVSIRPS
jgi:hypothetical protein